MATTKNSLLNNLHEAKRALRVNLLRNDLSPIVRQHIERAVSHINEAYGVEAFTDQEPRTFQTFLWDLESLENLDRLVEYKEVVK